MESARAGMGIEEGLVRIGLLGIGKGRVTESVLGEMVDSKGPY